MATQPVSDVVINRLPLYLRMLTFLQREGKTITSSQELSERLDFSSAQIRKDLSYFGEFGKQGTGYNIEYLQKQLRQILHVDHDWEVVLVGAGDLGRALVHYQGFAPQGFKLVAIFDNAPQKIGMTVGDLVVQTMTELPRVVRSKNVRIAILAVPEEVAQQVADELIELGIRAILCYASITLSVPSDVKVHYIDPVAGMQSMMYYL
ncbi:MAG: redox-sensing transcriptional repressor Rex [Chloroflexi bacterium]|nr:redox-sensing transcriptional repressor Rex [Chloroflexota bacterium]